MINISDIDTQFGHILPDIQNNITKHIQSSKTILGGIFETVNLAMIRKKRQLSIWFKYYAFKVVYYLNTVGHIDDFASMDRYATEQIWIFASFLKDKVFPRLEDRTTIEKYFPECFTSGGEFQLEFIKCVYHLILITKNYDNGECIIPFYNKEGLLYQSVKKNGFVHVFVQAFAEELLMSESLDVWEFGVMYYGRDAWSQISQRIKYSNTQLNQFTSIIEEAIRKSID